MSSGSERVKKWRWNTKNRIIESMGGRCVICGYNKCQSALVLHHIDPLKKEFGLGSIRANSINWTAIAEELKKCVMLCQNCHCEIHENIVFLPESFASFNELFYDYKSLEIKEELDSCPICGGSKSKNQITCSIKCSNKKRGCVDWDSINLEDELKTKTQTQIAEGLGCSHASVWKRLRKLGLR